jgi:hypothetical protein
MVNQKIRLKIANIKTFIYKLIHKLKYALAKLRLVHELLLQTTESKIQESDIDRNAYAIFADWLMDVLQYGIIITVIYIILFMFTGTIRLLCLPLAFGMLKWLHSDLMEEVKQLIR